MNTTAATDYETAAFIVDSAARVRELGLTIVASQRARAHSQNEIIRRHCTQRIAAAQAELTKIELRAAELAAARS